jgi:TPP-dependent trihydroxycyclohexane-1,2-dione (THcHDO) dehydratase
MLGMHGTVYANRAVHEADLLIAVGARFDDRVTGDLKKFAPHAKVIHMVPCSQTFFQEKLCTHRTKPKHTIGLCPQHTNKPRMLITSGVQ